jgi:hypothetical protein
MTNDVVYGIQCNGQNFTIRISHPKAKYKVRGYLTDASNIEVGSGRWDTPQDADSALKEIARRVVARQELEKNKS